MRTDRIVGTASAPGHSEKIGIPIRDAAFHTHLLGPTGSAKSTVMLGLIAAAIPAAVVWRCRPCGLVRQAI